MNETTATPPLALAEIAAILQSRLPQLRQTYGVLRLSVFGSYAAGQAGPNSDLDLLAEFDRPPTLFQFVRLERELSQRLGVKVDLAMKSALKPEIGRRILCQAMPLCGPGGGIGILCGIFAKRRNRRKSSLPGWEFAARHIG